MNTVQENTELFRKLQSALTEDKVLYNAFVASIASALKEVPAGTDLYDAARAVADRIIGREVMILGNIFTSPIVFAIEKTLGELGDSEDERIIKECLRRSAKMWKSVELYGISTYGMTHEQFCEQLEEKRNVIFMSDSELEDYKKAIKIMNVLNE